MGGGERLGQPSVVLALPSLPAEFTLAISGRGYGLSPYIHADRLESREHLYVITATAVN